MLQTHGPSRSAGERKMLTGRTHVQVFKYLSLGATGKPTIDISPWDVYSIAKKAIKICPILRAPSLLNQPLYYYPASLRIQPFSQQACSAPKGKAQVSGRFVNTRFFTWLFHQRSNRDGFGVPTCSVRYLCGVTLCTERQLGRPSRSRCAASTR